MAQSVKKRRNTYLLVSILLVAFLFSYYLFTYIPNREAQINQRGIRIINRVSNGLDDRIEHYKKSVNSFACDYYIKNIELLDSNFPVDSSSFDKLVYLYNLQDTSVEQCSALIRKRIDKIAEGENASKYMYDNDEERYFDFVYEEFFEKLKIDPEIELLENIPANKHSVIFDELLKDSAYLGLGITPNNALKSVERFDFFEDFVLVDPTTDRVLDQSTIGLKFFKYEPQEEKTIKIDDEILKDALADIKEEIEKNEETKIYHIPNVDITRKEFSGREYYCYTTYLELDEKPYYLTGIISVGQYNDNVRQVSIWVILVFVLVLLFLVQVLPIIKPFILSKKERLQGLDVIWSALAVVFGISVLTLIIIGFDTFAVEEVDLVDEKLDSHADIISDEFKLEMGSSITILEDKHLFDLSIDSMEYLVDHLDGLLYADSSDMPMLKDDFQTFINDVLKSVAFYKSIPKNAEFLDINNLGKAKYYRYSRQFLAAFDSISLLVDDVNFRLAKADWIADTTLAKGFEEIVYQFNYLFYLDVYQYDILQADLDISHRNYFTAMRGNNPTSAWGYGDVGNKKPIYIESLFSLADGVYKTIVAVKGEDGLTYAIDYPFKSVNDRYLEPNFSFAVIDKAGVIQYHTHQELIKNENFLEECDMNRKLISYLHNDASNGMDLRFAMKDYQAYIKPIPNTPWYVVTAYDIRKSRLNITQSMTTTFEIVIFLLFYLVMLNIVLRLQSNVSSHGHARGFKYLFMNPVNTSPRVFSALAIFNVIVIALLIGTYQSNAIALLLNIAVFFSLLTISLLLSFGMLVKYSLAFDDLKSVGKRNKITGFEKLLLLLWVFWFLAVIWVDKESSAMIWFVVVSQLIMLAAFIVIKTKSPFESFFLTTRSKLGYVPFYIHTFSWVCILGVLSSFLFFKPIYNMQHIKRALNNWYVEYDYLNDDNASQSGLNKVPYCNHEPDSSEIANNAFDDDYVKTASDFLDQINLYFDEDAKELMGQGHTAQPITVVKTADTLGMPYFYVDVDMASYHKTEILPLPNTIVAFDLPSIDHQDNPLKAFIFWIIILLCLVGLYLTIKALSQKFFYLNLLTRMRAVGKQLDLSHSEFSEQSAIDVSLAQVNIMLIGPPYSGRNRLAKKLLNDDETPNYLDFLNELSLEKAKVVVEDQVAEDFISKPIIINNFDYRIFDFEHNKDKLEILERIIQGRNEKQIKQRLVLISNFDTNQLLEVYHWEIERIRKTSGDQDSQIKDLENEIYRWESILFGFTAHVVKLQHEKDDDFILNEVNFGSGLKNIEPQIRRYEKELKKQQDWLTEEDIRNQLIEAIMDMAQNYYFAIWNACSREEKFLLYDMAQDGLINSKNERIVTNLVRKGILLTEPTLRLFNSSFARFVLENISEEEGLQMEREAKKEGVWGTYQFLVIFLIIVIVVFLTFVEKEAINKMTGIITVGGALLPKVIQVVSNIGTKGSLFKKGE